MSEGYSFISNSSAMLILCGLAIAAVLVQSAIFMRTAWKRALELGFTRGELKRVVKSSAIFSIIPSLPILISYVILLPALGKYFPWLRLSVIGSASYETMAANAAVASYGYEGLGNVEFAPEVYGAIMWVLTLGMLLSSLSVLILKKYDKKMKQISENKNSFGALVPSIMFLGMMASFSAPYLADIEDIAAIGAIAVSAGCMILLNRVSGNCRPLKEFAFPVSMVAGMAAACLISAVC